jgi:ferritin-like protein
VFFIILWDEGYYYTIQGNVKGHDEEFLKKVKDYMQETGGKKDSYL